jgi:hypothetical protein
MLRATVLILALCAAYVHGLGFVNTQLLPEMLLSGTTTTTEADGNLDWQRLSLFRDLIYKPTNIETALPLRNLVLLENLQGAGVDPFNAMSQFRSSIWQNPVAFSKTAATSVVVSIGPDVRQRDLLEDGVRVIHRIAGCRGLDLNMIPYWLCPEGNIFGTLKYGVSGETENSVDNTFMSGDAHSSPSFRSDSIVRHDMFY